MGLNARIGFAINDAGGREIVSAGEVGMVRRMAGGELEIDFARTTVSIEAADVEPTTDPVSVWCNLHGRIDCRLCDECGHPDPRHISAHDEPKLWTSGRITCWSESVCLDCESGRRDPVLCDLCDHPRHDGTMHGPAHPCTYRPGHGPLLDRPRGRAMIGERTWTASIVSSAGTIEAEASACDLLRDQALAALEEAWLLGVALEAGTEIVLYKRTRARGLERDRSFRPFLDRRGRLRLDGPYA